MNSFRSILALLSILGAAHAAPQGGVGANIMGCFFNAPGCGAAIMTSPALYVQCALSGGINVGSDAACYQALLGAGLISGACAPCASLLNPQGATPPAPVLPA